MAGAQDEDKTEILGSRQAGRADPEATVIDSLESEDETLQLTRSPQGTAHDTGSPAQARRRQGWIVMAPLLVAAAGLLIWQWPPPTLQPDVNQPRDIFPVALALAKTSLLQDSPEMLPSQLLKLQQQYPDNPKLSGLLADSNLYLHLHQLLATDEVLTLAQQRAETPFSAPLFARAAEQYIAPLMPAADILQQLQTAEDNWRRGELVQAMEGARQLALAGASEHAAAFLAHYTRVVTAYEELSGDSKLPDYPSRLLAFYLALDPVRDRFYWQRLQRDFDAAGDAPEDGPQARLLSAGGQWQQYHQRGGIDAAMRQQATRYQDFSRQAQSLSAIYRQLGGVSTLAAGTSPQSQLFPQKVSAEITLQRQRLQALLRHNADPLLAEKLGMLPAPDQQYLPEVDK